MVIYNHHRNKCLWGCFQKGLTEKPRVTLTVGAIKSILGSHTEWDRGKKLATDILLLLLPDCECIMMLCFPCSHLPCFLSMTDRTLQLWAKKPFLPGVAFVSNLVTATRRATTVVLLCGHMISRMTQDCPPLHILLPRTCGGVARNAIPFCHVLLPFPQTSPGVQFSPLLTAFLRVICQGKGSRLKMKQPFHWLDKKRPGLPKFPSLSLENRTLGNK